MKGQGIKIYSKEQFKIYKPLLTSQQEIAKSMQDAAKQIVESQNERQTALQPLLPLLQNIQKTQIAGPRRQLPSLPTDITPSNLRHSSIVHCR